MRYRNVLLVLLLVTVLVVSLFLIVSQLFVPVQSESEEPFFVGVEIGWRANVTECKAMIDEVKNYTNLLVLAHSTIMCDEAALNETCDYAYDAGMYLLTYFGAQLNSPYYSEVPDRVQYYPFKWAMQAKDRYGDHFLGAYFDDEPGGNVLERGNFPSGTGYNSPRSFGEAARSFVQSTSKNMDLFSYFGQQKAVSLFTSDFGLYWFDYKAGYDVVLAEFVKNHSRPLHLAMCRGAAKIQNKDWGIMITWKYDEPPYTESADELYADMVFAYNSGAKYVTVYDAWSRDHLNSTLTDDRLDALKNFWQYVQQNPDKHGSLKADTVLVLPENYGFGFRKPTDTIWGYIAADNWTKKLHDDVYGLLEEYGSRLDIVYSDPEFDGALADNYNEVLRWTPGSEVDTYPVVNLNTSMGYLTIQDAISSFATDIGDTIFVKAGVYQENVFVNKGVTLIGEDRKTTIIDGDNRGTAVTIIGSYLEGLGTSYVSDVTVTGFTIKNGNFPSLVSNISAPLLASGIQLNRAYNCSIVENDITGNGVGIFLNSSGNNLFRDNNIENNVLNFGVEGNSLFEYFNDVDSSNTLDGKPICYLVNKHNFMVPSDVGYVALVNCTDITVQNLQLANNYNGLVIAYTQNSTITDNRLTNNWEGLRLIRSSGNVLSRNEMNNNKYAFSLNCTLANDIDVTNTADGKKIIYWVNQHSQVVPSDSGYVALINCTSITVQNLELSNNRQGVLLINTNSSTITQNTITNQINGIEIESSSNNTISNNLIEANTNSGINLFGSDNNSFAGNTITDNAAGICLDVSSDNSISRNNITANYYALQFSNNFNAAGSSNNTIKENYIALNQVYINMEPYANANNTFYHNNFIDNKIQLENSYISPYPAPPNSLILSENGNSWDNGSEGNYWSDYETKYPDATELDGSGIWDTSYIVLYLGTDNFPLVQPFNISSLPSS